MLERRYSRGVGWFNHILGVLVTCVALVPRSLAQPGTPSEPAANPARPTVSTPATLTPVGYLQFETGVLGARDSLGFSSRYGINEVIKLSVVSRLEFLAASEPVAHSDFGGRNSNDAGDVFLGVQAIVMPGEGTKPTLAVSYLHHVYAGGASDFDVGTPENSFIVLGSADVRGFHYDANAIFNQVSNASVKKAQLGQSLSISHTLAGPLSISGEVWHFNQPFAHGHAVGSLWALGYSVHRNLVLDAGFNRGITSTSTRWEAFAGFTYLLPHRLW